VYITVWDSDQENLFVPYDLVDEYVFDYIKPAGERDFSCYDGIRYNPKSRYV